MVSIGSNLVSNLNKIANNTYTSRPAQEENKSELDFKEVLYDAIDRFKRIGDENALSTLELLTGNTDDLANTMISAQKSELAVNLTVAIRNKAIEAYKEIMNMQV
ncbi:MAG: flagellar hook-basal body complex protein FliE [Clostridiales bacterium]|jgi:flagellar hook-basal body complex protein FliE|nr:flagellar hook-basal body complex protein FliE [Clostridiales bacterium]